MLFRENSFEIEAEKLHIIAGHGPGSELEAPIPIFCPKEGILVGWWPVLSVFLDDFLYRRENSIVINFLLILRRELNTTAFFK